MKFIAKLVLVSCCLAISVSSNLLPLPPIPIISPLLCILNTCTTQSLVPAFHVDCDLTCRVAGLGAGNCSVDDYPVGSPVCICDDAPGEPINQVLIGAILTTQCDLFCPLGCNTCGFSKGYCNSTMGGHYSCECSEPCLRIFGHDIICPNPPNVG